MKYKILQVISSQKMREPDFQVENSNEFIEGNIIVIADLILEDTNFNTIRINNWRFKSEYDFTEAIKCGHVEN